MKPIQFYSRVVRVDNPVVSDTIWMKAFDNTINGATIHVISIGTIKSKDINRYRLHVNLTKYRRSKS